MNFFKKLFRDSKEPDNENKSSFSEDKRVYHKQYEKAGGDRMENDEYNTTEDYNSDERQKEMTERDNRIQKAMQEAAGKGYSEEQIAQAAFDESQKIQEELMAKQIEKTKDNGLLAPIHGVTIEDWAAANAKINNGANLDELLKVLGIEKPIWDEVSAEWMARMSRDTTYVINQIFSNAYTNPDIGKFNPVKTTKGAESSQQASQNVQKVIDSLELYAKIMAHQNAAAHQGISSESILKQYGLSVGDFSNVSMHWGNKMRTVSIAAEFGKLLENYQKEFDAPKVGDDIEF